MAHTDKSLDPFGAVKEWYQRFYFSGGAANFYWNSNEKTIDLEMVWKNSSFISPGGELDNFRAFRCERKA